MIHNIHPSVLRRLSINFLRFQFQASLSFCPQLFGDCFTESDNYISIFVPVKIQRFFPPFDFAFGERLLLPLVFFAHKIRRILRNGKSKQVRHGMEKVYSLLKNERRSYYFATHHYVFHFISWIIGLTVMWRRSVRSVRLAKNILRMSPIFNRQLNDAFSHCREQFFNKVKMKHFPIDWIWSVRIAASTSEFHCQAKWIFLIRNEWNISQVFLRYSDCCVSWNSVVHLLPLSLWK